MSLFPIHTIEDAPQASREFLKQAQQKFGFIPNLIGMLAESPAAVNAYVTLSTVFQQSFFTPAERQILLLTTSRENGCAYCVASHSLGALQTGAPKEVVNAIREDRPILDARLAALHRFCCSMVEKRGWVAETEVKAFLDAGFTKAQVLEVVLAISLKTLSNYTNHLAEAPLDAGLQSGKWEGTARGAMSGCVVNEAR